MVMIMPQVAAQNYPVRSIRVVVPFPAGGGVDSLTRMISQKIESRLGQRIIVDNRSGAEGIIGTEFAAKAAPDGYTLLMASSGHWMLPALHKQLPYDPVRDFSPISRIVSYPMLLLVHPSLPAKNVSELVGLAKKKPGRLNYASSGAFSNLTTEKFRQHTGATMTHIPYKGGAPALVDLASGNVEVMFNVVLAGMPYVRAGRLRALAITSLARSEAAPELPTIAESGYPGFSSIGGAGLVAQADASSNIVALWHQEIIQTLKFSDIRKRISADGGEVVGNTPSEFAAEITRDVNEWIKVSRSAGIHAR